MTRVAGRRPGRPHALNGEQVAEAVELRAEGWTFASIAHRLGVHRGTLRHALRVPEQPPKPADQTRAELGPAAMPSSAVPSLRQIRDQAALDEASDPGSSWYPPSGPRRLVFASDRRDLSW